VRGQLFLRSNNPENNMDILIRSLSALAVVAVALFLTSCHTEDPGPLQEDRRDYNAEDFDRLEMGDAFDIEVRQGTFFEITARGDERNLDDLEVTTEGTTLVIRYRNQRNRKHTTYIEITMPTLAQVNFSDATQSTVTGFTDLERLRVSLSGASKSQVDVDAAAIDIALSGASRLTLAGGGDDLSVNASGASELQAFSYAVLKADVNASGASRCKVSVSDALRAVASGGSSVIYRGSPTVDGDASGGSRIEKD
jgi:hypothetical protein